MSNSVAGFACHSCNTRNPCPSPVSDGSKTYTKFLKFIIFGIVTLFISIAVSRFCGLYLSTESMQVLWSNLKGIKIQMNAIKSNYEELASSHHDIGQKLKEISDALPKLIEASIRLQDNVKEEMTLHTQKILQTLSPNFDQVRTVVQNELATFDADKIGLTDYALESAGGCIASIRDTQTYVPGTTQKKLLGVLLCQKSRGPQSIIQAGVLPGECWAFKGNAGTVVIQLLGKVHISSISLEHIPHSLSPTGEISTAPKDFSVWGLKELGDREAFFFGTFTYSNEAQPLQKFEVKHVSSKAYNLVEVNIHSNHGNHDYTCIYRFRVHGTLETNQPEDPH